ncbi:MAG: nucleotidyltransferase family protein [Candidatus Accumulibacter sp.]|uniref:nucleotidyltransferase family protein n=1 Tax=Accumulibacter sp. TaxID=2053492 RepID=UPI00258650C0|nr:nucleotidyltransferase family protein [Accumulibacter sp.]MCM8621126.1 nucleotidyltransferase family protein [Accumulibacter sp.]
MAGALGQRLSLSDLPTDSSEWEHVLRLSSRHLVSPQLRWALREQGLFHSVPTEVAEYLEAVYTLNLERNSECENQLCEIVVALGKIGVQPVFLKGAAAILGGFYPTSGERMITDLDVLVPAEKLSEILDELACVGYRPIDNYVDVARSGVWQDFRHHYPPLFKPGFTTTIELHVQPVELPYVRLLSSEEVFRDARRVRWRGLLCSIPSPTHFITQNAIHAFLVDTRDNLRQVSLRQLFEFTLASGIYGSGVAWTVLRDRFDEVGYGSALREYSALASTCLNFRFPPAIRVGAWNRFMIQSHLIRLDLDVPLLERMLRFFGQLKWSLGNLSRKPALIAKLAQADSYRRWFNSLKR